MTQTVKEQISDLMNRLDFPEEAKTCFTGVETRFEKDPSYYRDFTGVVDDFMSSETQPINEALEKLHAVAEAHQENIYTMDMMFCLHGALYLPERYKALGWPEEWFYESTMDFTAKVHECMTYKNVPGSFTAPWAEGWLRCTRLKFGRLEYDLNRIYEGPDCVLPSGMELKHGVPCFSVHIPSVGGSLTLDSCLDSYRKAAEYFKVKYHSDIAIFQTDSWLLFPKHTEFLPKNSNILRFMSDFYIMPSRETDTFTNAWRVFGSYADLPVEEWPENTSLRRAYKKWILEGHKTGTGFGVIVMKDGKNITK